MKIYDCAQYSEDWYKAKIGIPTASQFHNIITPNGVPTRGDRRRKYLYRLVSERLLQQSMDDRFENYWTKRGKELEDDAATAFASYTKFAVENLLPGGFITTDDGRIGCSPDRRIKSKDGKVRAGLEVKCPAPWVQVEYLLAGPEDNFKPQVQGQIMIGEFSSMHLWCWHPQTPPVHVVTNRDEDFIEKMARELYHFCNELDAETERAKRMGPFTLAKLLKLSAEMADDIPGTFPWIT